MAVNDILARYPELMFELVILLKCQDHPSANPETVNAFDQLVRSFGLDVVQGQTEDVLTSSDFQYLRNLVEEVPYQCHSARNCLCKVNNSRRTSAKIDLSRRLLEAIETDVVDYISRYIDL